MSCAARKTEPETVTFSGGISSSRESTNAEGKIMRVFVTGAAGELGRHLLPRLVAAGHEVSATTRTSGKVAQLREAGSAGGPARRYRVSQPSRDSSR
jgi:NADPH:quinone reductase-like Zn-dependent oxidoreductase